MFLYSQTVFTFWMALVHKLQGPNNSNNILQYMCNWGGGGEQEFLALID
jgi:hypothetical protein